MTQFTSRNRILARLLLKELSIVEPHLERMPLVVRQRLSAPNKPITHVYFADQGIVSVVATGARGQTVEAGVIGWEGVTGLPVILGTDRSPNDTFVQVAGDGRRIPAEILRHLLVECPALRELLYLWCGLREPSPLPLLTRLHRMRRLSAPGWSWRPRRRLQPRYIARGFMLELLGISSRRSWSSAELPWSQTPSSNNPRKPDVAVPHVRRSSASAGQPARSAQQDLIRLTIGSYALIMTATGRGRRGALHGVAAIARHMISYHRGVLTGG